MTVQLGIGACCAVARISASSAGSRWPAAMAFFVAAVNAVTYASWVG